MRVKIGIMLLILCASQAFSQQEVFPYKKTGFVSMGVNFQMWKDSDIYNAYNQLSAPLELMLPLGKRFSLDVTHTPAISWWYDDLKVAGLSDTWVKGTYVLKGEKLMFNFGIGLPTGVSRLDSSAFKLSQVLSRNIYKFKLPSYGQGLSLQTGFAWALPLSRRFILGLGANYLHRRGFYPVKYEYGGDLGVETTSWEKEYVPGDEAMGQFGFDLLISENFKIMFDGIYTYYFADKLDSIKVFEAGDKLNLNLAFYYRFDNKYVWWHVLYRQLNRSDQFQRLLTEGSEFEFNGYQLEMSMITKVIELYNTDITLNIEGRYFGKNDIGRREEYVFGGGLGAQTRINPNLLVSAHIKMGIGMVKSPLDRELTGIETGLGLRYEF